MGIWDRLETVIKSYLHDEDIRLFGNRSGHSDWEDPDLDTAFEELNEFLDWGGTGGRARDANRAGSGGRTFAPVPEALRADFAELGVAFGASADECKTAYKQLLKQHHPDHHSGHAGNFKKATDKTARINAAYDRIEQWRRKAPPSGR
ncbi:MAG: J domain-containing protein [Treponema sp.]|jgi:DnaJ-domain-containing protein 1|nr:J domain-containing protein [Treponema sp.]